MATRNLQLQLQLNTEAAKKALTDLTNQTRLALNPNNSNAAFVKESQTLDQMTAKLRLLAGVQTQLANQKGMSQEYAKVTSEIAGILSKQKSMVTTEEQYLKLLQAETAERKKAASVSISAHSDRQAGLLKNLQGGTSQVFGAAGLPGGGLIGATGPLGAFTAGLSLANKELDEFGQKAQDLSKIISDSGGPLDDLRKSVIGVKQAEDALIDDPAIAAVQKFKNELQTAGLQFLKGAIDEFVKDIKQVSHWVDTLPVIGTGGTKSLAGDTADFVKNALGAGNKNTKLIGETKVEYENLKHDRISMETEIAMQEQQFAVETARKKRDLALETQKFEMEQARKKYDLEKDLARQNQDYQIEKQKLTQDQAFQTSQKKFQLDMQFEQRAFQQKIGDERQDFQLKQSDARQDYALQQSFKAQDYAKEASRRGEDYRNQLTDMGMSGAGGLEYLHASREFSKTNRRASEDYQIEQQRAGQEFGIQRGRDARGFNLEQGRQGRDYDQNKEKTLKEHGLDVDQHYYELRYQSLELEMKHNRAVQDLTTNLERLAQDTAIGRQELSNKKSDLTQDTALTRQKMNFDESEKRRSQGQKEMDFGGSLVDKIPTGDLQKLMQSNPELAKFVLGDLGRKGLSIPGINAPDTKAGKSGAEKAGKGAVDALPDTYKDAIGAIGKLGPAAIPLIPLLGLKNLAKDLLGINLPGFADGGYFKSDKPGLAMLHPNELILNKTQQQGLGLLGSSSNQLTPLTNSANPVAPIQMPGGGGQGNFQPVQISVGNDTFHFDGPGNDQIQQIIGGFRQEYLAKIQNAMSAMQTGMVKSQQRVVQGGWQ